jgi:hypothetical protein
LHLHHPNLGGLAGFPLRMIGPSIPPEPLPRNLLRQVL